MKINKAVGIDLGTTNSCVGVMSETDSEVILHRDKMGVSTTPSCVWFDDKRQEIVVGKRAFRRRGSRPEPIVSIKRKMGTTLLTSLGRARVKPVNLPEPLKPVLGESRQQRLQRYLARIEGATPEQAAAKREKMAQAPPLLWLLDQPTRLQEYLKTEGDPRKRQRLESEPPMLWLPEEISALILAEMRTQIQETLKERFRDHEYEVNRAIITVPAYFGTAQLEATKEAGLMAGLRVLEILQEPTAAAIYYCWKHNIQDGNFLVFDLGGGTFDVSIVRRTLGQFDVPGISGNNLLGGDDMDSSMAEWIRRGVMEEDPDCDLNLDPEKEEDRLIRSRFVLLAEGVKKSLTTEGETWLRDSNTIRDKADQPVNIEMVVSRDAFEELIQGIVDRCIPKCWEALARAKKKSDISLKDIDQVFLVGGSTHVPLVQRVVREHFCRFEGAQPYTPQQMEAILEEIQGDDEGETGELRSIVRQMMMAGERAKVGDPLKEDPDLCVAMGAAIKAASYGTETAQELSTVAIHFLGPRGTSRSEISIKGSVASEAGSPLAGCRVRLLSESGQIDKEVDLDGDQNFLFRRVPLQTRSHNRFEVCVTSPKGDVFGKSSIVIEQSPDYSEVPSSQDSGTTLSKAITMDVKERGQLTRQVLIASGAALPAKETHTLRVPTPNTGMLSFRLYQANRHLKTISTVIDPTLPPGTPVELTFSISQDHFMKCEYRVGTENRPESAIIEPPPPVQPPTPAQVEALNRKISEELGFKTLAERIKFQNRARKINEKLEQGRAAADSPKLIDAFEELEALHGEIARLQTELKPPWKEFDDEVARCRQLAALIEKEKPDYPVGEVRKNLDVQRREAQEAYNAKDQQLYGEHYTRVKDTRESLEKVLQEEDEGNKTSPEEQAAQEVEDLLECCEAFDNAAANFGAQFKEREKHAANPDEAQRNRRFCEQCGEVKQAVAGCRATLENLKTKCAQNPNQVLAECRAVKQVLGRCRQILLAMQGYLTGKGDTDETIPEVP